MFNRPRNAEINLELSLPTYPEARKFVTLHIDISRLKKNCDLSQKKNYPTGERQTTGLLS